MQMINPNDRKRSFELFGYDFMIDEDFKVWLIEVNTNPCLALSSSILKYAAPLPYALNHPLSRDCVFALC